MPDTPWRDRVEGDDYPYPRASDAASNVLGKPIPEDMLASFKDWNHESRFFGEALLHLRDVFQEQIDYGTITEAPFRTTLVRDIDILHSTLDKLARNRSLEPSELEMLAVEPDPDNPEALRLRHDVVGEMREHREKYRNVVDHPVDDYGIDADARAVEEAARYDDDTIAVLLLLEEEVRVVAVTLGDELREQRGRSSPPPQ